MKKFLSLLLVLGILSLSIAPITAKASTTNEDNVYQIGEYVFTITDYKNNGISALSYTTTHTTGVNITDTSGKYIATIYMNTTWEYQDGSYVRCLTCNPPTYTPTTYKLTYTNAEFYTTASYATVSRPMIFAIPPTQMSFYLNVTCDTYGEITSNVTSSRPF